MINNRRKQQGFSLIEVLVVMTMKMTVMMVVVLDAVGLPATAVGLILAVDRVLDMARTSVNVWSDSTAAAVVARLDRIGGDEPSEPSDEGAAVG